MIRFLLPFLLSGCAWHVDMPGYRMTSVEWNHIQGPDARKRLAALCSNTEPRLSGCAVRVRQTGQCVVYSIFSEQEAKAAKTWDDASHYEHEVGGGKVPGHCGKGLGNGYNHG